MEEFPQIFVVCLVILVGTKFRILGKLFVNLLLMSLLYLNANFVRVTLLMQSCFWQVERAMNVGVRGEDASFGHDGFRSDRRRLL